MDIVILCLSFLFSLFFTGLGFAKRSPVLSIIGSLTMMLTGIFLYTTAIQTTGLVTSAQSSLEIITGNITAISTNSTYTPRTYTSGSESSVWGLLLTVFSGLILIYSMKIILYGQAEEGG